MTATARRRAALEVAVLGAADRRAVLARLSPEVRAGLETEIETLDTLCRGHREVLQQVREACLKRDAEPRRANDGVGMPPALARALRRAAAPPATFGALLAGAEVPGG